ncbi:MAG TPA: hypothetical protein VMV69_04360 [Pirellulales bacterium]|nr:hypothetical protein [Pirellulales bacterium]
MQHVRSIVWAMTLAWTIMPASAQMAVAQDGAAEPDDENTPPTVRLNVRPAAPPRPALKYQLLPDIRDRRPGNAAVHYNKRGLRYPGNQPPNDPFAYEWLDAPLGDLPLDKVRA